MAYDAHLTPVLKAASNEELNILVDILSKPFSQTLTPDKRYEKNPTDPSKYIDLIAEEIVAYGGYTFISEFITGFPSYADVVRDVAKNMKVKFRDGATVEEIEDNLLMFVGGKYWDGMTPEERKEWLEGFGANLDDFLRTFPTELVRKILTGGGKAQYKMAMNLAAAALVGVAGEAAVASLEAVGGRVVGALAGAPGWILFGVLAAAKLIGPAYRVTRPSVIYVAALRRNPEYHLM